MEDTHGANKPTETTKFTISLNPYYNGRYSWRMRFTKIVMQTMIVLILIIMEDTHGGS